MKKNCMLTLAAVMAFSCVPVSAAFAAQPAATSQNTSATVTTALVLQEDVDKSGDGWEWSGDNKKLTLDGFTQDIVSGSIANAIELPKDSIVYLENENEITISGSGTAGIYCEGDLTIRGSGSLDLEVTGGTASGIRTQNGGSILIEDDVEITIDAAYGLYVWNAKGTDPLITITDDAQVKAYINNQDQTIYVVKENGSNASGSNWFHFSNDIRYDKYIEEEYVLLKAEGVLNDTDDTDETEEADKTDETENTNPFTDLEDHPAKDAALYLYEKKYMNGTSATTFSPDAQLSRGMLVYLLYTMNGSVDTTEAKEMTFQDVPANAYYTDAVVWAVNNGIIAGYNDTAFGPNDPLTKEQFATILYHYEKMQGGGFTGAWSFLLDCTDRDTISSWAYEPLCYFTMNDVLSISDSGMVNPKAVMTRGDTAIALANYLQAKETEA